MIATVGLPNGDDEMAELSDDSEESDRMNNSVSALKNIISI